MVVVGMRFLAGLVACALTLSAGSAMASDITNVRFGAYETHTRIVIESETPLDSRAFTLAEPVSRLVVSFDQAGWDVPALPNRQGEGEGLVGRFQFDGQAGAPRLVFALNSPSTIDHHFSLAPMAAAIARWWISRRRPRDDVPANLRLSAPTRT
jgi:N-acetylmuramoyl-L-alanine amidase